MKSVFLNLFISPFTFYLKSQFTVAVNLYQRETSLTRDGYYKVCNFKKQQ